MAGLIGQVQKAPDFSSRVSEASEAGEKFVEVFYDTFDKRRQVQWYSVLIGAQYCDSYTPQVQIIIVQIW